MTAPMPPDSAMRGETPRTDAAIQIWRGEVAVIDPEFARQLERELAQAKAALAEAQRDALRYRWLRRCTQGAGKGPGPGPGPVLIIYLLDSETGVFDEPVNDALDAAIDAAAEKEGE